jgi:hypothetical protein
MRVEHRVINESELDAESLAPSVTFARLVKRVGDQAALGTLGLGAIHELVVERAANADVEAPAFSVASPESTAPRRLG